jgi:hypothetical protein
MPSAAIKTSAVFEGMPAGKVGFDRLVKFAVMLVSFWVYEVKT